MGIVLAVVVLVVTLGIAALQVGASAMSDAPSQEGISVWPTLVTGSIIAALLAGSHFFHLAW